MRRQIGVQNCGPLDYARAVSSGLKDRISCSARGGREGKTHSSLDPNHWCLTKLCVWSMARERSSVNCVQWSPNGHRVLTATHRGELILWNSATAVQEAMYPAAHAFPIRAATWSPDDQWLITGDEAGTIKIWKPNMTCARTLSIALPGGTPSDAKTGVDHVKTDLSSKPETKKAVVASLLLGAKQKKPVQKSSVRGLTCAPQQAGSGKFAACADTGQLAVFDTVTGECERLYSSSCWTISQTEQYPHTAVGLEAALGPKAALGLEAAQRAEVVAELKSCDWHPWLAAVASGSRDGSLCLWDVRMSIVVHVSKPHTDALTQVKWNRTNGLALLTGSRDGVVCEHDVRQLSKPLASFANHQSGVTAVAWHPVWEHHFATGGADGALYFCSSALCSTALRSTALRSTALRSTALRSTALRSTALSSSALRSSAHPSRDKDQQQTHAFVDCIQVAHDAPLLCLAWHPLGHVLVSGSLDNTLKFWTRSSTTENPLCLPTPSSTKPSSRTELIQEMIMTEEDKPPSLDDL